MKIKLALSFWVVLMMTTSILLTPLSVRAAVPSPTIREVRATNEKATADQIEDATRKVEYPLPYPGILPDHPLFPLKRFRDWMLEKLIADPVRKAEFYILQADKRLNMAVFLKGQGKDKLAAESVTLSLSFRRKVLRELSAVKGGGKIIPGYVLDRLEKSIAKHIEVLTELGHAKEASEVVQLGAQAAGLK